MAGFRPGTGWVSTKQASTAFLRVAKPPTLLGLLMAPVLGNGEVLLTDERKLAPLSPFGTGDDRLLEPSGRGGMGSGRPLRDNRGRN